MHLLKHFCMFCIFFSSVWVCAWADVCGCVNGCPFPSSLGCKAGACGSRAVQASFGVISALVSPVMLNLNYHSSSHRDTSFILMWPGRDMR